MKTTWAMGLLALAMGCGAPAEDGLVDENTEAVTVREGDYDLTNAAGSGQPYVGVAVVGSRAYLAKGYEGLHVLDLRTMRVSARLWSDRNNRRIPADGLQVIGRSQLLAYWQGNPLGDLNDDRQMLFVNVFNTTSQTVTRTVAIDLTGTYESARGPLHQLPNVEAHLDPTTNTLYVSFGHLERPDKLFAFPMPTGNAELRLANLPGARALTVDNPHGVFVAGGTAWVPSSSDGLRAVDLTTGRASVRARDIGYAVDVAVRNTTGFVADHNGNLRVLDLASGRVKATRALPGFTDGLTVAGGSVFVVWRNGVSVFRDVWSGR